MKYGFMFIYFKKEIELEIRKQKSYRQKVERKS